MFSGNVGIPLLELHSPVQGGDVHVVGDSQDTAEATAVSGDRVPSQSHYIEHTPSAQFIDSSNPAPTPQPQLPDTPIATPQSQLAFTPFISPQPQLPDVASQMGNII